jgi:hypothetical protein
MGRKEVEPTGANVNFLVLARLLRLLLYCILT